MNRGSSLEEYFSLAPFVGLVFAAALSGAFFMPGAWYASLNKPSWTPPDWLFPIAWTVLYLMIAVAGWLVWKADGFGVAFAVWGVGLVFNAAWSWIMFGQHKIGWALADLVGMWLSIVAFIVLAWSVDSRAALLFVPYFFWTTFAGALNYKVLRLNS